MKMRDKQFNEACKATIEIKENPFEIKKVSLLNADCEEGLNAHIDHFKKVMSDFHKSMARGINGEA
jgi:replication initiation and membrane attachment protein DnaB